MAAPGGLWGGARGDAVIEPALNLLRYPRRGLAWPVEQWRPLLLAWLLGAFLGGLWAAGRYWHLVQLRAQGSLLQAQVQSQLRQQSAAAALRAQAQLQQAVQTRAQDWRRQQEQGLRLHATLDEQAEALGLHVTRWQNDGRQLLLQGWLPRAQDVPALLSALSAAGPQGWTLQSLGTAATSRQGGREAGVEVALQALWPSTGLSNGASSKPEHDKARP